MDQSIERGARVLVVVGTRPEGIKLAPVIDALRRDAPGIETRLALTGQHSELMDQVLSVFQLTPDWDLDIMTEGQDVYDVAHGCMDGLRGIVEGYRPHLILVQGDTATVFFAGLVAFLERTNVGHVEAGLRSRDKWRPYPEEIFRRLTGVIADVHFAPTHEAAQNLRAEGVAAESIHVTGNTVVDALERIAAGMHTFGNEALRGVGTGHARLVLVTAHRRESFGEPLRRAFLALRDIADRFDDVVLVYPVHPNPNVRQPAEELLGDHPRVRLTRPLDYLDLVHALKRAALVITDSGGIQEEAPSFGTPVLVLREVTERPEGIRAGVAQLVGTDRRLIVETATAILGRHAATSDGGSNPYGDGHAAERIADILAHRLTGRTRRTTDWETVP